MVGQKDYVLINLSLEEVAVHAGHDVSVEVDDNSAWAVGDTLGNLG
jgi:hypothetical protein